jgi:hypothetical protein
MIKIVRKARRRGWYISLLVLLAVPLEAQETIALLGDRLRIRRFQELEWRDGSLVGFTGDSVRLLPCLRCTVTNYARRDLAAVEVRVDNGIRGSTVLTSAVIGVAVGAAVGVAMAARANRHCRDGPCGLDLILLPPLGGAVGLALGVGVGMSIRYDNWRPARL